MPIQTPQSNVGGDINPQVLQMQQNRVNTNKQVQLEKYKESQANQRAGIQAGAQRDVALMQKQADDARTAAYIKSSEDDRIYQSETTKTEQAFTLARDKLRMEFEKGQEGSRRDLIGGLTKASLRLQNLMNDSATKRAIAENAATRAAIGATLNSQTRNAQWAVASGKMKSDYDQSKGRYDTSVVAGYHAMRMAPGFSAVPVGGRIGTAPIVPDKISSLYKAWDNILGPHNLGAKDMNEAKLEEMAKAGTLTGPMVESIIGGLDGIEKAIMERIESKEGQPVAPLILEEALKDMTVGERVRIQRAGGVDAYNRAVQAQFNIGNERENQKLLLAIQAQKAAITGLATSQFTKSEAYKIFSPVWRAKTGESLAAVNQAIVEGQPVFDPNEMKKVDETLLDALMRYNTEFQTATQSILADPIFGEATPALESPPNGASRGLGKWEGDLPKGTRMELSDQQKAKMTEWGWNRPPILTPIP